MRLLPYGEGVRTFLWVLHAVCVLVHGLSGVAGLYFAGDASGTRWLVYETPEYYSNATNFADAAGGDATCGFDAGDFEIRYSTQCGTRWNSYVALGVIEIVTALFHAWYIVELLEPRWLPPWALWQTTNAHPVRWIEYGVTATVYSLATVVGTGVRSLPAVLALGLALPGMQGCGALAELLHARSKKGAADLAGLKWSAFALGWLPQMAVFAVVALSLGTATGDVVVADDGATRHFSGWVVQSAFYFLHYMTFPLIFFLNAANKIKEFWFVELWYVAASVSAKLALFWLVTSTVREYVEDFGAAAASGVQWATVRAFAIVIPLALAIGLPLSAAFLFRDTGASAKARGAPAGAPAGASLPLLGRLAAESLNVRARTPGLRL